LASNRAAAGPSDSPDLDFGLKLRAAFFRRHPLLERVADFCVAAAVANATASALATHCSAAHRLGSATSAARGQARAAAARDAAWEIERAVSATMVALSPPLLPASVAATALQLTLAHALGPGLDAVTDAVAAELATQVQRHLAHLARQRPTGDAEAGAAGTGTAGLAPSTEEVGPPPPPGRTDATEPTAPEEELPPTAHEVAAAVRKLLAVVEAPLPAEVQAVAAAAADAARALPAADASGPAARAARLNVVQSSALLLAALAAQGLASGDEDSLLRHLPTLWRHCCVRSVRFAFRGPAATTIAALAPCLSEAVVVGSSEARDDGLRFAFFQRLINARLLSLASLEQSLLATLLRPEVDLPGSEHSPSRRARALATRLVAFSAARQRQGGGSSLDSAVTPLHCLRLGAFLSGK
jgi:hypothetical protein